MGTPPHHRRKPPHKNEISDLTGVRENRRRPPQRTAARSDLFDDKTEN
jgi:hypothetical protein